ncbi:hypothetical protein [Arthrobacter sp. JSM 101049]|uniref:hypothetical protein n=1 Tax=Arthrobacter sp. JSM 101049 TaxID=929097 RepID=UPI003568D883
MNFNIGQQTGGVINNVSGTQRITGGQHGEVISVDAARHALRELREAIDLMPLKGDQMVAVAEPLQEIDAELAAESPDRSIVRRSLDHLTAMLLSAGALATAGQALVEPLRTLATWVGSWGPSVAAFIGG